VATSESYDFTVNRDQIFNEAFGFIGIGTEGEAISGHMSDKASLLLNMIVKQLIGRADKAPNFKMWTREHATLFLQKDQYKYLLGPATTDDHATSDDYGNTTLSADAASGASTLTVTSITGISDADYALVMLDSGSWHQTTVNGTPAGSTVTLTDVTTGAAASGATVYFYTNKLQKPDDIIVINRRESDGDDSPVSFLTVEQYFAIPDKDSTGDVVSCYIEQKRLNTHVYFDVAVQDATDVVKFVALRPIQDFDVATDNADFPDIWLRPLYMMLGIDLAPHYGKTVTQDMILLKNEAMAIARSDEPENYVHSFQPNLPEDYE